MFSQAPNSPLHRYDEFLSSLKFIHSSVHRLRRTIRGLDRRKHVLLPVRRLL